MKEWGPNWNAGIAGKTFKMNTNLRFFQNSAMI